MTERRIGHIPEKIKQIGRAAAVVAVIGSAGYGTYRGAEYLADLEEKAIDARCGGPERDGCVEVTKEACSFYPSGWGGGDLVCGYVVEFVPKTPTPDAMSTNGMERGGESR